MQWLTLTHARRYHGFRAGAGGHVYQGRYKHFAVQDDEHFLMLCRYLEANPLRAKLVRRAQDWRWSSLRQRNTRTRTGSGEIGRWPRLSDWPVDRPRNWMDTVNAAILEPQLRQIKLSLERDRPLGSPQWSERIAVRTGLAQTLRPLGRPRKPESELSPRQRRRRALETGRERT